jgi:predicted DNA binding protein
MKKIIVVIMLSLVAFSIVETAHADCFQKLTNDYRNDSRSFQIQDSDVEAEFDINPISFSKSAVLFIIKEQVDCSANAINFSDKSNSDKACREISPGKSSSKICYLETNLGYFFISLDMLGTANITFNRWD